MFLEHGQLNAITDPTPGDLEFSTVDQDSYQHDDDLRTDLLSARRHHDAQGRLQHREQHHSRLLPDLSRLLARRERACAINDEVKRLNEAGAEVPDPLLVRISNFFWNIPVPH